MWELHEDYLRPQENGNQSHCIDLAVVRGNPLKVVAERPFSFRLSPYTAKELTHARHNLELQPRGCAVLSLDYRVSGVDSNSCGPALRKNTGWMSRNLPLNFFGVLKRNVSEICPYPTGEVGPASCREFMIL